MPSVMADNYTGTHLLCTSLGYFNGRCVLLCVYSDISFLSFSVLLSFLGSVQVFASFRNKQFPEPIGAPHPYLSFTRGSVSPQTKDLSCFLVVIFLCFIFFFIFLFYCNVFDLFSRGSAPFHISLPSGLTSAKWPHIDAHHRVLPTHPMGLKT